MDKKPLPTQKRLKEVLHYDPETGVFTWIKRLSKCVHAGSVAGCRGKRGWLLIRVDKNLYLASRLAWLYMTGEDPGQTIVDHEDRNKANDRFSNLRLATKKQNAENSKVRNDSTSGVCGVSFDKRRNRWYAYIKHNGKMRSLGLHAAFKDACAARRSAELDLFTFSPLKNE